jgi:cytochrome c553
MRSRPIVYAIAALLALPVAGLARGGWATITVETLPEYLVVGDSVDLAFTVRQHGMTPSHAMQPTVTATSGNTVLQAAATRDDAPGRYSARVAVPSTGNWTVEVRTNASQYFGTRLLPIRAVARGSIPAAQSAEERGRHLFVAKACAYCHVHTAIEEGATYPYAPVLSGRVFTGAYLTAVMKDPSMAATRSNGSPMPNLGLSDSEIASLVAFLRKGS